MRLLCPKCGEPVQLGQTSCPCGEALDARSVFKRWLEGLGFRFNRATAVRCPACNATGSLKFGYCTGCGCNFTVAAAFAPILRRFERLVTNISPAKRRAFQWCFLLLSVGGFLTTLTAYENLQPQEWLATGLLSFLFLPVLLTLFFWLMPKPMLISLAQRTARKVKLALTFNYFTLLLWLQLTVTTWMAKAIILAGICGMTIVAFYMFLAYIWPIWLAMALFFEQQANAFDPTGFQGKRARTDNRRQV